jgi:transposase
MQDPATFPNDKLLELFRQQAVSLDESQIQLATKDDIIKQLEQKNETLELAYDKLWRERFTARSERYINDADQLRLDFGDTADAADAAAGLAEAAQDAELVGSYKRKKSRKKRDDSLPKHLPRYEVTADIADELKNCDIHGERTLLPESMWDRIETLKFSRPDLKVRVTLYPKYACPGESECGITSPERPTGIVAGDKYDTSIAAEIITGKFSYHTPIYRQQDYFAGSGWAPARSTLLNILAGSFFIVEPLLECFKRTVQSDSAIGCDDTGVTLLYPKTIPSLDLTDAKQRRVHEVFTNALDENKPSINAKMWAYRGVSVKLNVFDFTVSRHRDGPELFFADYSGTVLGDCWHGFESIALASDGQILRAACNSHARRKIRDSQAYPSDRIHWMNWYHELYDIEDRGRTMSPENRLLLRQSEAKPIWDAMALWLEAVKLRTCNVILPKSDFAQALRYIRNHFTELRRYLDDALIPLDNNETEQLMKQVALGRKNWLFAGSLAGGERNAGFLTLVSSALRNDLDIWQYVKDVLDQLLSGVTNYEPLLPWNWAADHPDAIRDYRVEERKQRAARKQQNRQDRRTAKRKR